MYKHLSIYSTCLLQSNGQNAAHTIPNQGLFANTGYLQVWPAVSVAAGILFRF